MLRRNSGKGYISCNTIALNLSEKVNPRDIYLPERKEADVSSLVPEDMLDLSGSFRKRFP